MDMNCRGLNFKSLWKLVFCQILAFVFNFDIGSSYAAETSTSVSLNGQLDQDIVEIDVPELFTSMMATRVQVESASSVLVLYGRLGAKSKNFGIAASMSPIAKKAIKEKLEPVGFQNPVYYQDSNAEPDRHGIVNKFGSTSAQVEWLVATLRYTLKNLSPSKKLIVGGRSTGSSIILEALHRYLKSGEFSDVFSRIDHILIMGLVDHRPEQFKLWREAEDQFLNKHDYFDQTSSDIEPAIYKDMEYANSRAEFSVLKVPSVTVIVGINDQLTSAQTQIALARTISDLHPQLSMNVVVTDTSHNPASSVEYLDRNGKTIVVKTMKRLSPILANIFSPNYNSDAKAGMSLQIQPEAEHAFNSCNLLY